MAELATATLTVEALLPAGTYTGRVMRFDEAQEMANPNDGTTGMVVPVFIEIDRVMSGGTWEELEKGPVELRKYLSLPKSGKAGAKSNLYKIASACAGYELGENDPIDTDNMEGKRLIVTIEIKKGKSGDFSNITGFSPWKSKKSANGAAPAPVAAATPAPAAAKRTAPDLEFDD